MRAIWKGYIRFNLAMIPIKASGPPSLRPLSSTTCTAPVFLKIIGRAKEL